MARAYSLVMPPARPPHIVLLTLMMAWTGCGTTAPAPEVLPDLRSHFLAVTNFSSFTTSKGSDGNGLVLTSPIISTPMEWDELVVSWNASAPGGTGIKIEARAFRAEQPTKFYTLGLWSEDDSRHPRESVLDQKDADGDVRTDILALQQPARRVQLCLTLEGPDATSRPELKFMGLSFLNTRAEEKTLEPNRAAWGKSIPVPERSQVAYQGGRDWCSPTSVSMVLAHWAKMLQRPELDIEVSEVAKGVHDKNWPGTGNWPFNTAFAGRFPGMRGYVTRLGGVAELEAWIDFGVPVILSAPYGLLNGRAEDKGGHLVVCVGFTPQGDVLVNDPWAELDKGERVQRVYSRENVDRAWKRSRNTVYMIYPESLATPRDRFRHWAGSESQHIKLEQSSRTGKIPPR